MAVTFCLRIFLGAGADGPKGRQRVWTERVWLEAIFPFETGNQNDGVLECLTDLHNSQQRLKSATHPPSEIWT